jgi:hypothetical protein
MQVLSSIEQGLDTDRRLTSLDGELAEDSLLQASFFIATNSSEVQAAASSEATEIGPVLRVPAAASARPSCAVKDYLLCAPTQHERRSPSVPLIDKL